MSRKNARQTRHPSGNGGGYVRDRYRYFPKFVTLCLLCLLWFTPAAVANDIKIANGKVVQLGDDRFIEFDLSWENSWRTDNLFPEDEPNVGNWDAAWVFVKYRVPAAYGGDDLWRHVWLTTDDGTHISGTGTGAVIHIGATEIDGTDRGMGAFIYRSENGTGAFSNTGTRLRWEFAHQGLAATTPVEIRIFAIEMVYVAEGMFAAGSGGVEALAFTLTTINTAMATTVPAGTGSRGGAAGGYPTGQTAPNAAWPNGFSAFYMMKYSISQQQYVDFLNTLTYTQQDARIDGAPNAAVGTFAHNQRRHAIKIKSSGIENTTPAVYETDHSFVANNYMSWMDGAAYMDWSGLRPMTELEYEKAARGQAFPVVNEYAWGTEVTAGGPPIENDPPYTLSNAGEANEGIAQGYNLGSGGNAMSEETRGSIGGPVRVGIFAANRSNRARLNSGASYWGLMELSGNVAEYAVTLENDDGRAFTGLHGDGVLSANGHADVTAWPGLVSGEVTKADGSGRRGGSWLDLVERLRVSDRFNSSSPTTSGSDINGSRGVRSAPPAGVAD